MSHFSVAVITSGKPTRATLEEILAPYDEQLECRNVITREQLIASRKETIAKLAKDYEEYKKDEEAFFAKNPFSDRSSLEKVPQMLKWTDEQCYQAELSCYDDEEYYERTPDGGVIDPYNPNSKWDWWEIGGRWAGYLYVKSGALRGRQVTIGKKSWVHGESDPYVSQYVDCMRVDGAKIKDLVFPTCERDRKRAERFWELYIDGQEPQNDEERAMLKDVFYRKEYFIDNYKTKENYAKAVSMFTTYAIITKDGKWHQQGQMGWWGMSTDEDILGWVDGYDDLVFKNADEDDYMTIIDCHI